MHGLMWFRLRPGQRPASRSSGSPRARAAAALAAAGLASAGLAAAPASASVSSPAARPSAARAAASAGARPRPLSAQRLLAAPATQRLPAGVRRACPLPVRVGQMECMALLRTNTRHYRGVVPNVTPTGYGPPDLQSAYNLTAASATGGTGATIAVVDAYDDPNAEADLAVYRSQYGLPACTTANGCFSKVNEQGAPSPLPSPNTAWAAEIAIDLDMVSAICPNCHIQLVEATSNGLADLSMSVDKAIALGAKFVTDSWGSQEFTSESYYDNVYYNHPGVAITFSAGDSGYGTGWPAASQYVTSVGGTSLIRDSTVTRGWDETVWSGTGPGTGTGSGCSSADPKPSWQTADDTAPGGCLNRTENDVSATADPAHPVAVYNTYSASGWATAGGTSVSAPIIASVYALAGNPSPLAGTFPASYPYQASSSAALYDVTSGSNGTCETNPSRQYLCNGETGYDGPSGLGTPDGTAAFASSATANVVTVTDPGVQDEEAGTPAFVTMQANDSGSLALTYSATGLPAGLSIDPVSGHITGVLGNTTGTSTVTVTASDSTGATGSVTFSMVVMNSLATGYHPVAGPVHVDLASGCIDDAGDSSANGTKIQLWKCNGHASQNWTYQPGGAPGGTGTLTIHGKCLDVKGRGTANNTPLQLYTCNSGANQQWLINGGGQLYNLASKRCLDDPGGTTNGTQLVIFDCNGSANEAWILPASPVQSGVSGKCLDNAGDHVTNGNKIQIWSCNGEASQKWTLEPDGTLRLGGKCLDVAGRSKLDGARLQLYTCSSNSMTNGNQHWAIASDGELVNLNSGRCLDDQGDATGNGTAVVQEDCYGQAGEIWAVT